MPSTSPGDGSDVPWQPFAHISPGAPTPSLQTFVTFLHRQKRYIAYISGRQLNILSSPTNLIQAISFPQELVAVAAEPQTGRLAVATSTAGGAEEDENESDRVSVCLLEAVTKGWSTVWWEKTLVLRAEEVSMGTDHVRKEGKAQKLNAVSLSWGTDGEILVASGRQLCLFSTLPSSRTNSPGTSVLDGVNVEVRWPTWKKVTAAPALYARFSPTASLIATSGARDRLVKIWRRLSYEEGLFDYTYLPHPAAITHLEWRALEEQYEERRGSGISGRHEDQPEILYTIAMDGLLRVWRTGGMHELDILTLQTSVDLVSAIPMSPSLTVKGSSPGEVQKSTTSARYAFILPSEDFSAAVTASIGLNLEGKVSHSHEHLKAISSNSPEIVIALDGSGRMSAWGLHSIGHKRRTENPASQEEQQQHSVAPSHVAHAEQFPLHLPDGAIARFAAWFEDAKMHLLVHDFGSGELQWWMGTVESFFSPSTPPADRIRRVASWNGHLSTVQGVHVDGGGSELLSWSDATDAAIWKSASSAPNHCLTGGFVKDAVILGSGQLIASLQSNPGRLVMRDARGEELAKAAIDFKEPCRLFTDQVHEQEVHSVRLVILTDSGEGKIFNVSTKNPNLEDCQKFSLPSPESGEDLSLARPVMDPKSPDHFGVVRASRSGRLVMSHVRTSKDANELEAVEVGAFDTGIVQPSHLFVNNDLALLTSEQGQYPESQDTAFINLRDGYIEKVLVSDRQFVRHIAVHAQHNLVAVAYESEVNIFTQTRYGQDLGAIPWDLLSRVSIEGTGLTINGIAWLADCTLAMAAGNGLFFASRTTTASEPSRDEIYDSSTAPLDLADISMQKQKPVPVWHHALLSDLFCKGETKLVVGLLRRLHEKMTFWSEGDAMHPLLNVPAEQLYGAEEMHKAAELDSQTVAGLKGLLEERRLPDLSRLEQLHLRLFLDAIVYCFEHGGGLDNYALRFLFEWKLQTLRMNEPEFEKGDPTLGISQDYSIPSMGWRETAFAYHSTTQQPLLDILIAHYDNKITWPIAKQLGIVAWLNSEALAQIFEALAQTAYRSNQPPDPTNATLYFLALHKKSTLLALWRMATWHKEQRATMKFLQRDFSQPEHKTAAKKNAYALMGKRRFEYAASFFLLADDPGSATSILAGQCQEDMLAIAVARLYSGEGSDMLRKLIDDRISPDAKRCGDRWRMSWCYSVLNQRDSAADALIQPLDVARKWVQDDPNTLVLYNQLRKADSGDEWEAVLRASRILTRQGLWLAALTLVRNWQFPPPQAKALSTTAEQAQRTNGIHQTSSMLEDFAPPSSAAGKEPPSMLDDFSSISLQAKEPPSMLDSFAASTPPADDKASREAKAAELLQRMKAKKAAEAASASGEVKDNKPKPEPTQFKEPDANSLLDSFGF